jgi:branched-chain amino acid aminotransferase
VIIWFDGALMPLEDARLSPLDRGVTVGDGVFETLRVYDGTPFAWRRHWERFTHSARALGLPMPDAAVVRAGADSLLAATGLRDARLRITVTGGEGPPGSSRPPGVEPTVWIVALPFEPRNGPADVVIAPWTHNEHSATAGLKTTSYAANVRALAYAESQHASEAIFANTAGNLCEATGSNVFVVHDGVVHTPPANAGCLLGVTRALVLELARARGLAVEEADLPVTNLATAQEAFLSSSTREVQPIARVDGASLPAAPGPITLELAAAFTELRRADLDP